MFRLSVVLFIALASLIHKSRTALEGKDASSLISLSGMPCAEKCLIKDLIQRNQRNDSKCINTFVVDCENVSGNYSVT